VTGGIVYRRKTMKSAAASSPVSAGFEPLSDDEFAALSKALGHPARVAIVRRLVAEGQCVCGRIVECMSLAQSTVSQHLKVLKESGLLLGEVDGPRVCYCVDPRMLARFAAHAAGLGLPALFPADGGAGQSKEPA